MKKTTFLLYIFLLSIALPAQEILNPSFEDWEIRKGIEEPTHWNTNNAPDYISISKDTSGLTGTAIRITGNSPGFETAFPGIAIQKIIFEQPIIIIGIRATVQTSVEGLGVGGIALRPFKNDAVIEGAEGLWQFNEADSSKEWRTIESYFPIPIITADIDFLQVLLFAGGADTGAGIMGNAILSIDDLVFIVEIVSSAEEVATAALSVYPNPCRDILHIELEKEDMETILLYDIYGRLLLQEASTNQLSLANLPSGTYLLQVVRTSGRRFIRKIQLVTAY